MKFVSNEFFLGDENHRDFFALEECGEEIMKAFFAEGFHVDFPTKIIILSENKLSEKIRQQDKEIESLKKRLKKAEGKIVALKRGR